TGWRPLLAGRAATDARRAVDAVAAALRTSDGNPLSRARSTATERARQGASVAGGTAGLAVLYGYLSRAEAGRLYKRIALRFLEQAGDAVASITMGPSLYGGFT